MLAMPLFLKTSFCKFISVSFPAEDKTLFESNIANTIRVRLKLIHKRMTIITNKRDNMRLLGGVIISSKMESKKFDNHFDNSNLFTVTTSTWFCPYTQHQIENTE